MNRTYIGIDPGSKGFVAICRNGEFEYISIADSDLYVLSDKLKGIKEECGDNVSVVMEDVHAIFGSSAKATFEFGHNKGYLVGLLCAHKFRYTLISPQVWQKEIWTNQDKVVVAGEKRSKVNTKATSINAFKRLFPGIDPRKSKACKNPDDNKVDATLMAEYARRKNL